LTKQEIKKLLSWVLANFPSMQEKDMQPTAALWLRMLSDIPYNVAEKAVIRILATAKYFPTVAEIREAANELTAPKLPTPGEAWAEVLKQMRKVGSYGKPKFSHQVIEKAVNSIGWQELCMSTNTTADRAHFMKIYETLCKRAKEEKVNQDVLRLIGGGIKRVGDGK